MIGDWIALAALVVAAPPFVDWVIRMTEKADLYMIPPDVVELRGVPWYDESPTEPERRIIFPDKTRDTLVFVVAPVSYSNTGNHLDAFIVEKEILKIYTGSGDVVFEGEAFYDTVILNAETRHWWLGDIETWLPFALLGGEIRSSQVVFAPTISCQDCTVGAMFDRLTSDKNGIYKVNIEVTARAHGEHQPMIFTTKTCELSVDELLSFENATPDHRRYYRRQASCNLRAETPRLSGYRNRNRP